MTARQGPGGRIPPDNRGAQAPGVGKNSKRHDLERQATPGLAGSDLQQGDVQAMEEGQRIAPVQKQQPARPQAPTQARTGPAARQQQGGPDLNDIQSVINSRLQGTMGRGVPVGKPDEEKRRRGAGWVNFLSQLARQPGASPLLRATVEQQVVRQVQDNSYQPRGGFFNLNNVDDAIEGLLDEPL